ncbi:MAG TPA: hypothetical protein VMI30_01170 [Stellaceae bacterium]|nr:hypothetical protein [Stellaceae bacterium]
MLHIVEIRRIGNDLALARAELQDWLDEHQIECTEIEHSAGGPGITFRVQFKEKADAIAFAEMFHGYFKNISDGRSPLWAAATTPPQEGGKRRKAVVLSESFRRTVPRFRPKSDAAGGS